MKATQIGFTTLTKVQCHHLSLGRSQTSVLHRPHLRPVTRTKALPVVSFIDQHEETGPGLKRVGSWQDRRWWVSFRRLETFISEHLRLPKRTEFVQGQDMGIWCYSQRYLGNSGKLSLERRLALEGLAVQIRGADPLPVWSWNLRQDAWNSWSELLQEYIATHKAFPGIKERFKGRELGSWVERQVQICHCGKLQASRCSAIRASVPGWLDHISQRKQHTEAKEQEFYTWLQLLRSFVNVFKKLPSPADVFLGVQLGRWFYRQRRLLRAGHLGTQRTQRYQAIRDVKKELWKIISWKSEHGSVARGMEESGQERTMVSQKHCGDVNCFINVGVELKK